MSSRQRLYRSRNAQFLGVCEGIAKWRELPVGMVRTGVVIAAFMTGFVPALIVYIVIALILDPEPAEGEYEDRFSDFSKRYKNRKKDVSQNIRSEYENIKRRVSRMENDVINREKDWEERFRRETD